MNNGSHNCIVCFEANNFTSVSRFFYRDFVIPFIPHVGLDLIIDGNDYKIAGVKFDLNKNKWNVALESKHIDERKFKLLETWKRDEENRY